MVAHMAAKMLDDHLDLLRDVGRVQHQKLRQRPRRLFLRQVGVVFHRLHQFEVGLISGVVVRHIKNETLLDGLAHAVEMKGFRLAAGADAAEQLQGLALGRGGVGEKAQIGLAAARGHHLVQAVFPIGLFV